MVGFWGRVRDVIPASCCSFPFVPVEPHASVGPGRGAHQQTGEEEGNGEVQVLHSPQALREQISQVEACCYVRHHDDRCSSSFAYAVECNSVVLLPEYARRDTRVNHDALVVAEHGGWTIKTDAKHA